MLPYQHDERINNMFSVVIPLYNKENSIISTINSVLNQTYDNFEVIIVNDGSTDNSLKVVQSIKTDRIQIINKKNSGVSSARNTGITYSNGLFIAFLDADDIWLPEYLCEIKTLIDKYYKCYIFGTNYTVTSLRLEKESKSKPAPVHSIVNNYFTRAMYMPFLHTSAVVVKKICFDGEIKFNENLTHGEDLDLWSQLFKRYKSIGYSDRILVCYNHSAQNRACNIIPAPQKHFAYYLDLKELKRSIEYRYNLHQISALVWLYLKKCKIHYLFRVLYKYKKFILPILFEIFNQVRSRKYIKLIQNK